MIGAPRELTDNVSVLKTVDTETVGPGGLVTVSVLVTSWGDALGRTVEVRDYIPAQFTKEGWDDCVLSPVINEPGQSGTVQFQNEKRWRFALSGIDSRTYQIRARGDFSGWLGNALVLIDGYVVNVSGCPRLSTDADGYFITKAYGTQTAAMNEPLTVRLVFQSSPQTRFYVAVEDTLPVSRRASPASRRAWGTRSSPSASGATR